MATYSESYNIQLRVKSTFLNNFYVTLVVV